MKPIHSALWVKMHRKPGKEPSLFVNPSNHRIEPSTRRLTLKNTSGEVSSWLFILARHFLFANYLDIGLHPW